MDAKKISQCLDTFQNIAKLTLTMLDTSVRVSHTWSSSPCKWTQRRTFLMHWTGSFPFALPFPLPFAFACPFTSPCTNTKHRLPSKEDMQEARTAADNVMGKLILGFGGHGRSAGFSQMTMLKSRRKKFLLALKGILDEYGLDGVDFNWEFPNIWI